MVNYIRTSRRPRAIKLNNEAIKPRAFACNYSNSEFKKKKGRLTLRIKIMG